MLSDAYLAGEQEAMNDVFGKEAGSVFKNMNKFISKHTGLDAGRLAGQAKTVAKETVGNAAQKATESPEATQSTLSSLAGKVKDYQNQKRSKDNLRTAGKVALGAGAIGGTGTLAYHMAADKKKRGP